MKILLITATYKPSINGVAVSVENMKKHLEKKGHEVWVLAPKNKLVKGKEEQIIRYPSIENPKIKDYPIPLFPGIKEINKLIELKNFDIIHVHHPFHVGYFARLIAKRYGIPLVFTFHTRYDTYAEKYVDFLPKKLKSEFIANRVFDFCAKADFVVAPSKFIEEMIKKKLPFMPTKVIPTTTHGLKKTRYTKDKLRAIHNIKKDETVLLTVSRLSPEKNMPLLINSISCLPQNFKLVIVGGGPEEEKLKKQTSELGLTDRIMFIGQVGREDVSKYYQMADIFVYTSKSETQGLILLEAMNFGLPIVAVSSDASREWIDTKVGRLTKDDHKAFAANIKSIKRNGYTKFSASAYAVAKENSPRVMLRKILKVYTKVIKAKKLSDKLLSTGWQSWSPATDRFIKWPMWNYKPNKDDFLPINTEVDKLKKPVTGWCSWYAFGKEITEDRILSQTEWLKKNKDVPLEYILIDDGWTKRGDWRLGYKDKFPNGLKSLVDKIRSTGFKPGIWISPFLVERDSRFFSGNEDKLVKLAGVLIDGFKAFPFYNLIYPNYILDIRKENVRNLIKENIDYLLNECGFELIKLDFLYSIFFIPGITAKEAGFYLRDLLSYIKNKYQDVYTITCGSPLSPAVGLTDSMRIGPDIIDPFSSTLPVVGKFINNHKLKRVIGNVDNREWTGKYWNLDPDAFVCRKELGYTDRQTKMLGELIRDTKGNIFLGDDLTMLESQRIEKYIKPIFKSK